MRNTLDNKEMEYEYKFSIITAIYNTEMYLKEMIESVIAQDIGFKNNVELILIDDGSEDDSVKICREYEKKYSNIKVLITKHKGVSCARNIGLRSVKGKYINFLDSDDYIDRTVLRKVWAFFEEHTQEIDVVTIPLCFFDGQTGEHILNHKFKNNGIIDIYKNEESILLSSSSSFIKTKAIDEVNRFNEKLRYAEDAEFMSKIILKKGKYGVINTCKYFYRKRRELTSATQQGNNNREWFIDYIKNFSIKLLEDVSKQKNQVPGYIYYLIMYDLQWRINSINKLDKKDKIVFVEMLKCILRRMPIRIILKQKNLSKKGLIRCLLIKYVG